MFRLLGYQDMCALQIFIIIIIIISPIIGSHVEIIVMDGWSLYVEKYQTCFVFGMEDRLLRVTTWQRRGLNNDSIH